MHELANRNVSMAELHGHTEQPFVLFQVLCRVIPPK